MPADELVAHEGALERVEPFDGRDDFSENAFAFGDRRRLLERGDAGALQDFVDARVRPRRIARNASHDALDLGAGKRWDTGSLVLLDEKSEERIATETTAPGAPRERS